MFPAGALAGDVYGQDVPDVEGQDVGCEDVDVVGGIGCFAFAVDAVDGLDVVAAGAEDLGAFELHAPEAGAGVEDEVVAFAVSPGLGEVEAEGFGFEQEGGFGELSGAFGVCGGWVGEGLRWFVASWTGTFQWKRKRRSYWLRLCLTYRYSVAHWRG